MSAAETERSADAGWREWIGLNHLRGCSAESMVGRMVGGGWPVGAAERAVQAVIADPLLRLATRVSAQKAKLESVLANQQAVWQSVGGFDQVPRRAGIGRDAFLAEHCAASRPVIVTDLCTGWPAMQRWQPDELVRRFGACDVEIQSGRSGDPDYEINKLALRKRVRFADFMARLAGGEPCNDDYLTANNAAFSNPDFASLQADVGAMPPYLDRSRLAGAVHWWVGARGTKTPLHHDTVMLFHAQIVGSKRWRLISPLETPRVGNERGVFSPVDLDRIDFERFPRMRDVRVLDVVVNPGEAIFLPLGWWHQVDALDMSVSLSFSNLDHPNQFAYADPAPA